MSLFTFDPNCSQDPLGPSSMHKLLYFMLPILKSAFSILGVKYEALEIAKTIIDEPIDLAGERDPLFLLLILPVAPVAIR